MSYCVSEVEKWKDDPLIVEPSGRYSVLWVGKYNQGMMLSSGILHLQTCCRGTHAEKEDASAQVGLLIFNGVTDPSTKRIDIEFERSVSGKNEIESFDSVCSMFQHMLRAIFHSIIHQMRIR